MGLPFEIYRRTGSTLATGAMVLAYLIPSIALGSVAGVFVDRWDRRRLMVAINLVLAVALLPLLAMDALGLWVAYAVLLLTRAAPSGMWTSGDGQPRWRTGPNAATR